MLLAAAQGILKNKLQVVVAAGLGLVGVNFAVNYGYQLTYKHAVLQKLEGGLLPPPAPLAALPREVLREEVRALLRPAKPARFYAVVAGPPGAGKSTALRAACRDVGPGVGYFDVSPACEDFGADLGQAFDFSFEKQVGLFNMVSQAVLGAKTVELGGHKLGSLRRSAEALAGAAREYRAQHGRPFVLVLDSVDRLQAGQKEALQAFIKCVGGLRRRRSARRSGSAGWLGPAASPCALTAAGVRLRLVPPAAGTQRSGLKRA